MLRDIYENAAASKARGMTHGEFQVFGEQYPTVCRRFSRSFPPSPPPRPPPTPQILDSLCFRLRDSEEDARQQLQLARLRERIDGLKGAEATLLEQHRHALDGLDGLRATLDDAESAVASASATERAAANTLDAARADVERRRAELRGEEAAAQALRDEERVRAGRIELAQRGTRAALAALRAAEADLRDMQRELERRAADVAAREGEVRQAYEREEAAAADADEVRRRTADGEAEVAAGEEALRRCAEREQDALAGSRRAADAAREAEADAERARQEVRAQDDGVVSAAARIDRCQDDIREATAEHAGLERDNAAFSAQRIGSAEAETELLLEEVQLRQQRLLLETREAQLRTKTYTRRASPSPERASPAAAVGVGIAGGYGGGGGGHRHNASASPVSLSSHYDRAHYAPGSAGGSPDRYSAYTPRASVDRRTFLASPDEGRRAYTPRAPYTPSRGSTSASPFSEAPASRPEERSVSRATELSHASRYDAEAPSSASKLRQGREKDYAAVLHKAMKGFGTDEDAIYGVLSRVKGQSEWAAVQQQFREAYPKFYGGSVVKAMEGDLTKKEMEKCANILQQKRISLR